MSDTLQEGTRPSRHLRAAVPNDSRSRDVMERSTFASRMQAMLRLDFYRLFHTPVYYIVVAFAALIPALVLCLVGEDNASVAASYTNTWQVLSSLTPTYVVSDVSEYANINMIYIFGGILLAVFIGHDYTSGFIKSILTNHAAKVDYVLSKAAIGLFSMTCMVASYLVGLVFAGLISGRSFEVSVAGLLCCVVGKLVLSVGFSALYTFIAVLLRKKVGFSIVGCFFFGTGMPIMAVSLIVKGDAPVLHALLYGVSCNASLSSTPPTVAYCALMSLAWTAVYALLSTLVLSRRDVA